MTLYVLNQDGLREATAQELFQLDVLVDSLTGLESPVEIRRLVLEILDPEKTPTGMTGIRKKEVI
jgi:hypothetical protein